MSSVGADAPEVQIACLLVGVDSEDIDVIEPILGGLGYHACLATAADAMKEFERYRPGLVILGQQTPIEQLCADFRRVQPDYTKILVIGDFATEKDRLETFAKGADNCLGRPLNRQLLEAGLRSDLRFCRYSAEARKLRQDAEVTSVRSEALNRALTLATQRFGDLFNGVPVACFSFGPEGEIQDWNSAAEEQFGIPGYMAYQQRVQDVLISPEEVWTDDLIENIFENGQAPSFDWTLQRSDGTIHHFVNSLFLQRGQDGSVHGAVSASLDITERKRAAEKIESIAKELEKKHGELLVANRKLAEMAKTDTLTGLANRRAFDDLLALELENRSDPFSLVIIDVDHFKSFNDTFGHQVGDEVLRGVAETLFKICRDEETACRYGGEEFAILLPNTDFARSIGRAEAFRTAVEERGWTHRQVTISVGIATRPAGSEEETTGAELVARADSALYASKQAGRNCVTHESEKPLAA